MYTPGAGVISNQQFMRELSYLIPSFEIVTTNKKISYLNIPAAFDIETSSFYINGEKFACMYCWQFGIYNLVTMGRTWDEFKLFLKAIEILLSLSTGSRLIVYVHNLPYEFQFMRKWLDWDKVFCLENRKPVYCVSGGIEFKCSLKLSGGKKLESVAKDLTKYPCKKLVGYLDYSKIRTPLTPLTEKEVSYCENDIRVLLHYIQEKIEKDGDITRIPLTNTGYVRNHCRKNCFKRWNKYHNLMTNLTVSPQEFVELRDAFQGGFVHANHHYVRKVLHNVGSHDFGSSYPSVMVLEKFPMSKPILVDWTLSRAELLQLFKTHCCMFVLELFEVMPKRFNEHPISFSKCSECRGYTLDNGRIVTASYLKTTITEQDFFVYLEFYTFSEMRISKLRAYRKAYLPKEFVLTILEMYGGKTKLKGVEGEEENYMISKNMINASYGMSVTNPIRDEIKYINDMFVPDKANIEEGISDYNKNVRRFLYYPWGVWITAYSRANLFSGIIELEDDYVYSDTDSVKSLNTERHKKYFDNYNAQIVEKIRKAAEYHNISMELFMPMTKKGKKKIIGVWEYEGTYEKFKTLGAKRYLTFQHEHEEIHDGELTIQLTRPVYMLTLAGSNKEKTRAFLQTTGSPFDAFDDDLTIPSDRSGRILLTYIDEETEGDIVDYLGTPYHFHELSSIHMEPKEYHLSMSDQFLEYLEGMYDISE